MPCASICEFRRSRPDLQMHVYVCRPGMYRRAQGMRGFGAKHASVSLRRPVRLNAVPGANSNYLDTIEQLLCLFPGAESF